MGRTLFDRKLRSVRRRCNLNLFLAELGWALAAAGAVAVLAALAERALAVKTIYSWTLPALFVAAVALSSGLWWARRLKPMQAALLLDERLGLKERFSTVLALRGSEDPFARAADAEAHRMAVHVSPKKQFRLRPARRWFGTVATWLIAAGILAWMPEFDLLGYLRKQRDEQREAQKLQQAEAAVKQASDQIKAAVKELGDPQLDAEVAKLGKLDMGPKPEELKREAIRKLTDLSEQIKKLQTGEKFESDKALGQMLKDLRAPPQGLSMDLNRALARGDFAQAAELLRQIQKQMQDGQLTDEQRKALAEQLKNLGEQLQKLAKSEAELEKELENAGLDKELAKLDDEALKKALQDQGLTDEQIQELLRRAAALRSAAMSANRLGTAMAGIGAAGQAGEMSLAELDALTAQLDALEAIRQDLELADATLAQIDGAIAGLGEGLGELGAYGQFAEGFGDMAGPGTGGSGRGYGPRDADTLGAVKFKKTRTKSSGKQGPIVASWVFQGQQVKGEAKRELSEAVQAAKEDAADAVNQNRIPRKYQTSVKKYFGDLEEAAKQP